MSNKPIVNFDMCNPDRKCYKTYDPIVLGKIPDVGILARMINISSDPSWYFGLTLINTYMMCNGLYSSVLGAFSGYKIPKQLIILDLLYGIDILLYKISTMLRSHFHPTLFGLRPKWVVATEALSLFSMVAYIDNLPYAIICFGHLLRLLRLFRICHFNNDVHKCVAKRTLMKLYRIFVFIAVVSLIGYVTYCSSYCAHQNCDNHTCQYYRYGNILDCIRNIPGHFHIF